jgi:hypothetical protein
MKSGDMRQTCVSNQNAILVRDDGNTVASKSCDSLRHATAPEHQLFSGIDIRVLSGGDTGLTGDIIQHIRVSFTAQFVMLHTQQFEMTTTVSGIKEETNRHTELNTVRLGDDIGSLGIVLGSARSKQRSGQVTERKRSGSTRKGVWPCSRPTPNSSVHP